MFHLNESGCVKNVKWGVKLLGHHSTLLRQPVNIQVSQASATAIEAIEALGGTVSAVYHNRLGLRALLHPDKFLPGRLPKQALPLRYKYRVFYTDPKNRGYLAPADELEKARLSADQQRKANATVTPPDPIILSPSADIASPPKPVRLLRV